MTDDEIKDVDAEIEEGDEAEIDELVPLNVGEDEEDDSDEALATEGFSPIEGAEGGEAGTGEFDPEDPDAYLYNAPQVKYADSAEEDEGVWDNEEEF